MTDARQQLASAQLYVCTDARTSARDFEVFVRDITAAGVDIVQLRDKRLEARDELQLLRIMKRVCEETGALWAVNDRVDLAAISEAPVVHLGQADVPISAARALLGPEVIMGQSTHSAAQAEQAVLDPEVDYFAIGPLWPTATKPGREAVGLHLAEQVAHIVSGVERRKPWFAIGGIDESNVDLVAATGAPGFVVVRAVTQAAQPAAAVTRLRTAWAAASSPAQSERV